MVGERLSERYQILSELGRGGMGAVYAAYHSETKEPCAIKVLSAAIADERHFRERFRAEVDTLQTLRHPNIVRLLDAGVADNGISYPIPIATGCSCGSSRLAVTRTTTHSAP